MIRSSWVFYLGRFLFAVLYRTLWRCRVIGHENIPATGGAIIAPNHVSFADPPLMGASMRRPLHFMAKQELFDMPVLGFLIRRTNAFPVRRGQQDIGAIRAAEHLVKNGECLLVFPEGTRSKDGSIGRARSGLGMLACHTQAPVVPARIVNAEHLGRFRRITVIFGTPLLPPQEYDKAAYQRFSEQVVEEIKKLEVPRARRS